MRSPQAARPTRRPNLSRPAGRLAWALGPLPLLAAAFLLVSPLALGAVPNSTTLKAPFTKAVVTLTNPISHAGTGTTVLVVGSFFNATTGVGGFSDNASARWSSRAGSNNSAEATGRIQINLPITISTTGLHTITATWLTKATGGVNLTSGSCTASATVASSSCTRFAQAFVFGSGLLVDRTNSSMIRVQNWPGNHTSLWTNTTCAFTVCHAKTSGGHTNALHTGKAFWAWSWSSISLNASHKYVLEMFLFGGAEVTLMASGATLSGASGNANFNSGSAGEDETLSSVVIK